MPDLVLYLGVVMVSLGEVVEVSGGWSVAARLSRGALGKNLLQALGTTLRGRVGCTVDNNLQSLGKQQE